jgi:GNAT superfamily N-acetyltransferase
VSSAIRIESIGTSKAYIQAFIDVAAPIYADDPCWVQPLDFERHEFLSPAKNHYFDHATAQFFIAYRDNKPVGRISAQIDELSKQHHGATFGHWGLFESIDDQGVADALFKAAEDWLKDRGMDCAGGPYSLSVNTECGLLVDGFDTTPMIMMGHARPYYGQLVEGRGYAKEIDLYAYVLSRYTPWPERMYKIVEMAKRNKSITIRRLDKSNYEKELEIVFDIFNEAWSDNWGFIPFTEDEVKQAGKEMKMIIREHRAMLIEHDGEPAAFMIAIPDVNGYLADLNGKLLPFGWARLLWRIIKNDEAAVRVPLMGIKKQFQSKPIGALMALWLIHDIRVEVEASGGLERGELSWILETNLPMINILDQSGAKIYKTYRMYRRDL